MVMLQSVRACVVLAALCWGPVAAGAPPAHEPDRQSASRPYKAVLIPDELWPGEPVVIELTALEPLASQAPGVWPSLSGVRRLQAVISQAGDQTERWTVTLFQRSASPVLAEKPAAYVYVGPLRSRSPDIGGSKFIETPGEYTLTLRNPEDSQARPVAEPVTFSIRGLQEESEKAAFKLFKASSMDLHLAGEPMSVAPSEDIRTLAEQYPATRYGRYAVVLVAQAGYEEQVRKGDPHDVAAWSPVVSRLAAALDGLPSRHPLREDVLWHLARAEVQAGMRAASEEHAKVLEREFPTGKRGRHASLVFRSSTATSTAPAAGDAIE